MCSLISLAVVQDRARLRCGARRRRPHRDPALESMVFGSAFLAIHAILGLLILGAAFYGPGVLDFNHDSSSLIMALLAFGAPSHYGVA